MAALSFNRDFDPPYGVAEGVLPLVRRVVANNPGPFTFTGTGTYIVGKGRVAVIDPGPLLEAHVDALLKALEGETVSHILITHTHRDHSPASRLLQQATGAKTYGYGPHGAGDKADGGALLSENAMAVEVEEGGDPDFTPDVTMRDGDTITGDGWTLGAVHTPGHTSNHLCYALPEERALFTGDHVMGWSTTVVSPPDGNMTDYMQSLRRLMQRDDAIYLPTHGAPIREPGPFLEGLIAHREARMRAILNETSKGLVTIPEIVARLYADVPETLHGAAARSVFAHLIELVQTGQVDCDRSPPALDARYNISQIF